MLASCICPDCSQLMRNLNYADYLCARTKMQIGIETLVCLACGNSSSIVRNVRALEDNASVGRTEEISVTCFSSYEPKPIPQDVLLTILKNYYKNLFSELSLKIFNTSWIPCLELVVWDIINSAEDMKKMAAYAELVEIQSIFKNTGLWPVNSSYWRNVKSDNMITFVEESTWRIMLNKKSELIKTNQNVTDVNETGNS